MPSSRRRWSTTATAISIGMPTWSRITCGAAPVPPRKPSMYDVVGAGAHDAGGDGRDVVHGGDLDADRLRSSVASLIA